MAVPHLPALAELAGSLSQEVAGAESSAVFQVTGKRWSGKSTLLSLVAAELGRERTVLRAGPPAGANDAGPLALMQLAAGLKDAGAVNGDTGRLRDRTLRLEDKVDLVRDWVQSKGDVVLLLDEPERWGARSDATGHFAERAEMVADALLRDIDVPRVFTGNAPLGVRSTQHRRLPPPAGGSAFLQDGWGPLAATAADLTELPGVDAMTPLELRLLVAAKALGVREGAAVNVSRRDRADALYAHLDGPRGPSALGDAWRRLATLRSAFDTDLLERFAGNLEDDLRAILEQCLLLSSGDRWSMHENLRADARRNRRIHDEQRDVRALAEHYDQVTDELEKQQSSRALLTLMDAAYYAAIGGLRDLVDRRGCFVEQLDLLGKALSLEHKDYDAAVGVFELALELDPEDDYAAHYIGFNLDRLGREPARAEESYRSAITLNDEHVWWRSRLISFLAERGQLAQARREWDDALDAVLPPDGTSDLPLYETLHGWIAATLLRIGELGFARAILEAVPDGILDNSSTLKELRARLRAFELADAAGAYVPAGLLRDDWWRAPVLLQGHLGDGRLRLRRWLAGRIEAIDGDHVELRVADMKMGGESPRYARSRISLEDFDEWSRDQTIAELAPGRFVEIGLYSAEDGSDATRLLRVHSEQPVGADTPPPLGALDRWHQELAGVRS
ncbi:MAG: hypothetical protein ACR2LK_13225 [Solirubrobacteraceae bacterium]